MMDDWINVQDRLPTNGEAQTDRSNSIDCWCAVKAREGNYWVEHLLWNPFHQCWDDDDGDDVSRFSSRVEYWQLMNIPKPPIAGEK